MFRGKTNDCALVITGPVDGAEPVEAEPPEGGGGMVAYVGYVVVGTGCPTNWLGFASYRCMRTRAARQ